MVQIIVAFPKIEDAKGIKNLLVHSGFSVIAACTAGAQVLNLADELGSGIVVCGYRLSDMLYEELYTCLPERFEMLLVASQRYISEGMEGGIVSLAMPLKKNDLINTVDMMSQALTRKKRNEKQKPKQRDKKEQEYIDRAKKILMERNNMTEKEAHRYIQKCSMDSGTNMAETAQMVIRIMV